MNERQFNQRVIPLQPVTLMPPVTSLRDNERRAAESVLAMAMHQREGCNRVIDRLRAKLGMPPEER
jgi:hypothetical protein